MKTAKEREDAFRKDLATLLEAHSAELQVTDDGRPYGMHSGVCRITMMSKYDGDQLVADFAEFEL